MKTTVKTTRIISIFLLFLTGINALIAGLLFIIDPSGQKMGISTTYLSHSPFSTFLIPGIILFVVNGLLNIVVAICSLTKYKYYPILIIIQGMMLSGWILIQVLLVKDFNTLHLMMLLIGILLIALGIILKIKLKVD